MGTLFYTGGGVTELLRLGCTRAQGHLGILPRLVGLEGIWGDLGVVWGNCRGVFG